MGMGSIGITKYKEDAGIYYYSVSLQKIDTIEFIIGIDPKNYQVLFLDSVDLNRLLGKVNFNIEENSQPIEGIHLGTSNRVALQAYKAIQNNDFPDNLSINN